MDSRATLMQEVCLDYAELLAILRAPRRSGAHSYE
jgi:hypothetical protein